MRGDRDWILTRRGSDGHAVYGPYQRYEAGRYLAEFAIALPGGEALSADAVCGCVDVAADGGNRRFAAAYVTGADAHTGRYVLPFEIQDSHELEFRFHTNGRAALLIADGAQVRPDAGDALQRRPLPDLIGHRTIRQIYDKSADIDVDGDRLVMRLAGIRFAGRNPDDVNFVDELFFKSAYNFKTRRPTCVIDVGMNVGLASLLFAANTQVAEVHAFEPFASTFLRGCANIALNPDLAAKITTHNFGLSDKDEDVTLAIDENGGDSGGMQTRSVDGGTPMRLTLRDAAGTIGPIVANARARGLDVVVKIDCEGAEFPIFASLGASGLLNDISAMMVEWHRIFDGRNQAELIDPLLSAGFTVFDVTPPEGNGFFYAARTARD